MINLLSSAIFSFPKNLERENQDSILPPKRLDDGYIFAIADGVGSYSGAKDASSIAIEYLSNITSCNSEMDINMIFSSIKKEVGNISIKNNKLSEAATTLTFCFINNQGVYIGHIGDCRLFLKKGNKLEQITKDHTQYQKLLDERIYTAKELKEIPVKGILTTAISRFTDMEYDFIFIPVECLPVENNRIILNIMSDGAHHFWSKRPRFSENTMNNPLRFSSSLQRRIEKITPIDDYSLISVEFEI